jgi:hypothetical protein
MCGQWCLEPSTHLPRRQSSCTNLRLMAHLKWVSHLFNFSSTLFFSPFLPFFPPLLSSRSFLPFFPPLLSSPSFLPFFPPLLSSPSFLLFFPPLLSSSSFLFFPPLLSSSFLLFFLLLLSPRPFFPSFPLSLMLVLFLLSSFY